MPSLLTRLLRLSKVEIIKFFMEALEEQRKNMSDQDKNSMGKHHRWCNFSAFKTPEECHQCKKLNEMYPEEGRTSAEMMAKYFPDVIRIGGDDE